MQLLLFLAAWTSSSGSLQQGATQPWLCGIDQLHGCTA
jgi:hypothetical protein